MPVGLSWKMGALLTALTALAGAGGCASCAATPPEPPSVIRVAAEATGSAAGARLLPATASASASGSAQAASGSATLTAGFAAGPTRQTSAEKPATAADMEAARRAILAHEPNYKREYGPLRGDLGTRADLAGADWWATHDEAPHKSLRLWAEVLSPNAKPGEGVAHIWDVVQVSPGSRWTVILESDSSD